MWWTDDLIERTVTRAFVCSHLLQGEIERLDRPLAFGDGLTDGTYWEWIDQKAKKIFLILVDLHMPDQIFGVIDDSWDDEDLPIAREHVERLALTPQKDERLERKFYQRQFFYLLRPLLRNDVAVVYDDTAVVPLDVVDPRRAAVGAVVGHHASGSMGGSGGGEGTTGPSVSVSAAVSTPSSANGTAVTLPNYPGFVLIRRRVPLAPMAGSSAAGRNGLDGSLSPLTAAHATSPGGHLTLAEFQYEVSRIRGLQNDHLVSYFASYVHQGYGHVLFTPASDGSLKSLLATTPASFKALAKPDRRRLVFNWIHCLVDTLCFVHNRGLSHGNIKPSTVLLRTADLHIFFSDCTQLFGSAATGDPSAAADKASFDKESYDYAAPEQWYRPAGGGGAGAGGGGGSGASSAGSVFGGVSGGSRKGTVSDGSYFGSQRGGGGGGGGGGSMYAGSVASPEYAASAAYAAHVNTSTSFSISRSNNGPSGGGTPGLSGDYASAALSSPIPQLNPQAADVFSLGCIILELLSLVMKRQTRAFATHRAAKHKTPGRGGAVLDSSFHKNLGQLESWMSGLAKDAQASLTKKRDRPDQDTTLAGVAPMLHVVERMLALHASERPSIFDVQTRMYQILRECCGIAEPHCVHEYGAGVSSAAAAAAAAAAVAEWSDYAYASPSSSYGASSSNNHHQHNLHLQTTGYSSNYSYGGSFSSSQAVSPTATTSSSAAAAAAQQQQQQQQMMIMQLGQSWGSNSGSAYADQPPVAVKARSISSTPHYRPTYHHPKPLQQQQQQQPQTQYQPQQPQQQQHQHSRQHLHTSASAASLHTSSSSSHYGFQGGGRRRHARVPSNGGRSSHGHSNGHGGGGGANRDSAEDVSATTRVMAAMTMTTNNSSPPSTSGSGGSNANSSPGGYEAAHAAASAAAAAAAAGATSPLSPSASSSSFTKIKTNSSTGSGGGGGGGIDLTNGLQAIRNLQIRDKVRQKKNWANNAPVYAGNAPGGAMEVLEGVAEGEEMGDAGGDKKEKKEKKEKKHKDWFVYGPMASANTRRSVNA